VVFLGTNGLTVEHGLSTPDRDEAATKRAMVASSRRAVVLADASKIGTDSTLRFASLDEIDVLVTDEGASPADRRALGRAGLEVVVA
jgi:DeoR family fructose operon transcriptional repressor